MSKRFILIGLSVMLIIALSVIVFAADGEFTRDITVRGITVTVGDKTIEKIEGRNGSESWGEKWEVQQAWDKQNDFMKAQARAQGELRAMIKQYDEMLHRNWELATEEQRLRIEIMKAKTQGGGEDIGDDGFLEALKGEAAEVWQQE